MLKADAASKISGMLLLLCVVTVIGHLGIISNPGFYSHDEWEKFDHVERHGLPHFAAAYGVVKAGPEFGYPVRPLGFLQQAVSSRWMQSAPIIPHAIDVALHFMVAAILLLALLDLGARPRWAMVASLAFTLSPLTTMTTGWVAASFDQWYVLFVILACWLACKTALAGVTFLRAAGLIAAASCAILSKETALILPGAVVLAMAAAFLAKPAEQKFRWGAAVLVVVLTTVPLAIYLGLRWPAIENTLSGQSHSAYTPSLLSLRRNLVAYFAFPFLPQFAEFSGLARYPGVAVAFAIILHASLVTGVWLYAGARWAALYLLSYVMFVTPVLPLAHPAGHYIYGSSIPMALAIAAVLFGAWSRGQKAILWATTAAAVLLIGNTFLIQRWMYLDGVCQARFLASLDGRLAAEPQLAGLTVIIERERGARGAVGQRAVSGRWRYSGEDGAPRITFDNASVGEAASIRRFRMDRRCAVH